MQTAAALRASPRCGVRPARSGRLMVQAKVDLQGGPRVVRGRCFVTKDVSGGGGGSGVE